MDGCVLPGVTLAERLRARLGAGAHSLIWAGEVATDAAALWAGAAAWVARLCAAGLAPGDRVVCALAPGPVFIMVLVAALCESWTFAPLPPSADVLTATDAVDARAVVDADGVLRVRASAGPPTPDVRLLLATSGTTGAPRRLAISEANLLAVLDSHLGPLALEDAVLLSVLPWHHVFGLVLELLAALLAGAEIVRDPSGGRDVASMLTAARASASRGRPITHLHAVPYTIRLLVADDAGAQLLKSLRGGLVGGAPVDATLATALTRTQLRVGYGQTEASPGICLGEPGAWRAGTLGSALGCAVRVDDDGVLAFRGPNACRGEWHAGSREDLAGSAGLVRLPPDRWVRTGDLAVAEPDGTYTFVGRAAESFKLENGRYVAPLPLEAAVRARYPRVVEVVLSSRDGMTLDLALTSDVDIPPVDALRPLLGALRGRPLRVVRVAPDAWIRTPKGEIDRRFPVGRAS